MFYKTILQFSDQTVSDAKIVKQENVITVSG